MGYHDRSGRGGRGNYNIGTILIILKQNGYFDSWLENGKKEVTDAIIAERLDVDKSKISRWINFEVDPSNRSSDSDLYSIVDWLIVPIKKACNGFSVEDEKTKELFKILFHIMCQEEDSLETPSDRYYRDVNHILSGMDTESSKIEETVRKILEDAIFRRRNKIDKKANSQRGYSTDVDIDTLAEICGYIPESSFLGQKSRCHLEEIYVPTKLCQANNDGERFTTSVIGSECGLEKVLRNKRSFILGASGTGKTIALQAIAIGRCQRKNKKYGNNILLESTELDNNRIFLMRCSDIKWTHDCFDEYIKDSIISLKYSETKKATNNIELEKILKYAESGMILLVDGIEKIATSAERESFLNCLNEFLNIYPRTRLVLTALPNVWCGSKSIVDFCDEMEAIPYLIQPFSENDVCEYCQKWSRVFGSKDYIAKKTAEMVSRDKNLKRLLGSPLLLSYFLATIAPEKNAIFSSELMLISAMVDVATREFIADNIKQYQIIKYDIKAPLGVLALYMCLHNLTEIPLSVQGSNNLNSLSVEEVYREPAILQALDLYLSDQSSIRRKSPSEFLRRIKAYPFISIESRLVSEGGNLNPCDFLSFSSPVFQEYFASYAIGKGCLIGINTNKGITTFDTVVEFTKSWVNCTCQINNRNNDVSIDKFIKIIADAAIISRPYACNFIDGLIPFAADLSISCRTMREFAVRCLLRILANGANLSTSKWIEATDHALRYCLYHQQLDDLELIIKSSPRRELFVKHIYNSFCDSVDRGDPWPSYEWCIGYILFNWYDLSERSCDSGVSVFHEKESDSDFCKKILKRINSKPRPNNICELEKTIYDNRCLVDSNNNTDTLSSTAIAMVASLCSAIWIIARNTRIAELFDEKTDAYTGVENSVISKSTIELLFKLMKHRDQRVANQVCFSIVHCCTIKSSGQNITVSEVLDRNRIKGEGISAIYADYDGRQSEKDGMHALCGGVRYFTIAYIEKVDYGIWGADEPVSEFYFSLWNRYGGCTSAELISIPKDKDYQRSLMLLFKICFLVGAWKGAEGDDFDPRSAITPIKQLFKIKYPNYDVLSDAAPNTQTGMNQIGLSYDREEEFFQNLRDLYLSIIEN